MGGDVVQRPRLVSGAGDDLPIRHDDGADRHLATLAGPFRLLERRNHESVRLRHVHNFPLNQAALTC
jgi:hypothetical protein